MIVINKTCNTSHCDNEPSCFEYSYNIKLKLIAIEGLLFIGKYNPIHQYSEKYDFWSASCIESDYDNNK